MELDWNLKMLNAHVAQTSSCTWYVICPDKFLLLMRKLHFWSSMNHFLRLTTLDLPAVSLSRYSWSFSHNRQWAWLKSSLELSTLYSDFQLRYSEYRSSFSSNFTGWKIQESLIKQQKMWFKDIYLDIARGLPCCGSPSCWWRSVRGRWRRSPRPRAPRARCRAAAPRTSSPWRSPGTRSSPEPGRTCSSSPAAANTPPWGTTYH